MSQAKIQVKVCGIRRPSEAALAAELGAAFTGFIFHPDSPRAIDFSSWRNLREDLPPVQRVWVQVRPDPEELRAALAEGFDFFQLHFPAAEDLRLIEQWATIASPARLWLAPKIRPGEEFPSTILPFAETILVDTYREASYGGTGETGDWTGFRRWSGAHPGKRWVLAGGLKPENIGEAIGQTGATFVDVNSGVEAAPGQKDPERMKAFFTAVRGGG